MARWVLLVAYDGTNTVVDQMMNYGDFSRKSSGKHETHKAGWTGARFHIAKVISSGKTMQALCSNSKEVVKNSIKIFEELYPLYRMMLPTNLKPTRLSNSQARSLLTVRVKKCAWNNHSDCEGRIEAAHIKPDRAGGLTNVGNLFWLCRRHHLVVDKVFDARLKKDSLTKTLTASITEANPKPDDLNGLAKKLFDKIPDKSKWVLPLDAAEISHLFK